MITGSVRSPGKGDIYLYLIEESEGRLGRESRGRPLILRENRQTYRFEGISPGTYGIRCFQDENGNGKLDKSLTGPAEPWTMSWKEEPCRRPSFGDYSFVFDGSLRQIDLILK